MSIRTKVLAAATAGLFAAACSSAPAAPVLRTALVTRGAVTQTVAVSGSVSSAATVKLNPATNGKVAQLLVTVGQQVTTGQPLAKLDTTDLQAALTTAQNNLAAAQTNYDKAVSGVTDAQNTLSQTQQSTANDIATAQSGLAKLKANYAAAETSFANLSTSIKPDVQAFTSNIDGLRVQLQQTINDLSARQTSDVQAARGSLYGADTTLVNAQSYASGQLASALGDYSTTRDALANAISAFDSAVAAGSDPSTASTGYQTVLSTYNSAATRLSTALDAPTAALSSAQGSVTSAQQNVNTSQSRADGYLDQARADFVGLQSQLTSEAQLSSALKSRLTQIASAISTTSDAISGSYVSAVQNVAAAQVRAAQSLQSAQTSVNNQPSNVQSAQNSLNNAQTAVATAQNDLDNALIRATVSGVVTTISAQVGENVSSASTTGFIVIANTGSMALHGTVGEADVVKLKLGQVATITVDAVGNAKMTGKVTSLDPVATIAQGVPVYGIDVTIDLPSQAVKPGMSGTANVIIASSPNALTVPNLAVKTANGRRYLTLVKDGKQVDTDVTFGIANDTVTEVLSGVQEGDVVALPQPRATVTGQGGGGFRGGGGPVIVGR
ncbi:MAG TPA: efflux RND transporter periplasmic adaptor subunit [Candidatus Limnocylindria bacterium]|nr:efflux RND transporter periplasmic adaptor subunit [Candidatus Limnocylindria bacterium]